MIGYNPSHLNKNETLLEAFHRVEAYLKANPQYQVYQSSVQYQDGIQEYSLDTIIVPEGSKVSAGDVVLFSNSYYAVIAAVYELTFSVETAVSFRGPQGPKGAQGPKGEPGTNPNLLINPNFAINQRGKTSHTSTGYTVDRWSLDADSALTVKSNGVQLTGSMRQFYEYNDKTWGQQITFSFKTDNGILSATGMLPASVPTTNQNIFSIPANAQGESGLVQFVSGRLAFIITTTAPTTIYWAKLEIGSVATEFSPPNIAEELLKCQRYYVQFGNLNEFQEIALGQALNSGECRFSIALPARLRKMPTITYTELPTLANGTENISTVTSIVVYGFQNNILYTAIRGSGFTPGTTYRLRLAKSYLYVDAEI